MRRVLIALASLGAVLSSCASSRERDAAALPEGGESRMDCLSFLGSRPYAPPDGRPPLLGGPERPAADLLSQPPQDLFLPADVALAPDDAHRLAIHGVAYVGLGQPVGTREDYEPAALDVEWDLSLSGLIPTTVLRRASRTSDSSVRAAWDAAATEDTYPAATWPGGQRRVLCVRAQDWDVWVGQVTGPAHDYSPDDDAMCFTPPAFPYAVMVVERASRHVWALALESPRRVCSPEAVASGCEPSIGLEGAWAYYGEPYGTLDRDPRAYPMGCPLQVQCANLGWCADLWWSPPDAPVAAACAARTLDELSRLPGPPCPGYGF